jgi:hypothetical protein
LYIRFREDTAFLYILSSAVKSLHHYIKIANANYMSVLKNSQPNQLDALQAYPNIDPEWGEVRYVTAKYGIGRGKLYEMIKDGQITAKSLVSKGRKHGRVLINISLLEYYLSRLPKM